VRLESNLSSLIAAAETGESTATEALFSALYAELHGMAKRELARRGDPSTLSVTTLLHEAYLNMVSRNDAEFPDRSGQSDEAKFPAVRSRQHQADGAI
jgi:ECF sigma factor